MIEVKNLTKRYGGKVALDNVSFTVNDGEILGFLGPNGAGKSTTMNILTGYISSNEGSALINGVDVLVDPVGAKAGIGYLPEQPPLYLDMTVDAYLDFVYDLKKAKQPRKAHLSEICELVKITDVRHRIIKHLSKGYKQRVGLAQALIGTPPVLILDEPTVGLDPNQILEIRSLIKSLGKDHTIILSSHILPEIQAVCDRVIVINKGKIIADGTADSLSKALTSDRRLTARIDGPKEQITDLLSSIPGMDSVSAVRECEPGVYEYILDATEGTDVRREVFSRLASRHWPLVGLKGSDLTLEDVFYRLTNGNEDMVSFTAPASSSPDSLSDEQTDAEESPDAAPSETDGGVSE